VYIASCDTHIRAYDENDLINGVNAPIWSMSLGDAADPTGSNVGVAIGITSTPVLDPSKSRMFVCVCQTFVAGLHKNFSYHMFAIDMFSGKILQSAELVDPGSPDRNFKFVGMVQDQRGALNLVGGIVYMTFAAFFGNDLGDYHGWLVGCEADDLKQQYFLPTTRTVRAGGCWGPGGAAAASDGSVYIATGNSKFSDDNTTDKNEREAYFTGLGGKPPAGQGDYFMAIVKARINQHARRPPLPPVSTLDVIDWFQPATLPRPLRDFGGETGPVTLQELDGADKDFGSSSCLALPLIDGRNLVVVSTKAFVFLLDGDKLGQSGPPLYANHLFEGSDVSPPHSDGTIDDAESHSAPAYMSVNGEHFIYLSGGGNGNGLFCFQLNTAGPSPTLDWKWNANVPLTDECASPTVSVSTADEFGRPQFHALVWVADIAANTVLKHQFIRAYDAMTGMLVFDSLASPGTQLQSDLPHYAPITCAGQSVYIGTQGGFALFRAAVGVGNVGGSRLARA